MNSRNITTSTCSEMQEKIKVLCTKMKRIVCYMRTMQEFQEVAMTDDIYLSSFSTLINVYNGSGADVELIQTINSKRNWMVYEGYFISFGNLISIFDETDELVLEIKYNDFLNLSEDDVFQYSTMYEHFADIHTLYLELCVNNISIDFNFIDKIIEGAEEFHKVLDAREIMGR